MSSKLYQRFITLLAKYRVEPDRKGRCLGELVRRNVSKNFPRAGNTVLTDVKKWENNYKALEAIANDVDRKAFSRTHISASTGASLEMVSAVVSEYSRDNNQTASGEGEEVTSELKTEKSA